MKYIGDLHESIQKKLKLFKVEDINEANVKVMGIEEKSQPRKYKDKKHVNNTQKEYCNHCNLHGHTKERCWKLHPKFDPKRKKPKDDSSKKKEKVVLNTIKVEELFKLEQAYSKLSLIMRKLKTTAEVDLKACEKLFYLKIQIK